ncbi:hypothetical protein FACS189476_05220 [Spirochaetia bacterium]|nr:hypothetical protein FACS189476_05220 [Spirochaetia bacterium]
MQIQIAEKKRADWLEERVNSIQIKTRPRYCRIFSLALSAAILLGMLAAERLPSLLQY